MQALSCTLLSLFLLIAPSTVTVAGRVVDRSAKPAINAKVVYANPSKNLNYTGTTDAKGQFEISGLAPGSYQVTVTDAQGNKVYSGKTDVWRGADDQPNSASADNFLLIDLSKAPPSWAGSNAAASMADVQRNEQAEMLRQKNANALKTNELMTQLQAQREARDWPKTADTLQQLLALYPDRWQFYWNLGDVQSNLSRYEEASRNYAKGVEVAQKSQASGASEPAQNSDIGAMLLSAGDAYTRMGKTDQAIAMYNQATPLFSQPAQAFYRVCNAQVNRGNAAAAIEACNQAITLDPNQWEFYQPLAGAQVIAGKNLEALQTYDKGVATARKELTAKPDALGAKVGIGQLLTAKGILYSRMERYDEAIATFSEAAASAPNPALPQYNLCATFFNRGRVDDAITACDKAITADPSMADAYYVKGSALFGLGRLEYGKYVAPAQTRETLNKYLGLNPSGPHAEAVRGMLDKLGPALEVAKKKKH